MRRKPLKSLDLILSLLPMVRQAAMRLKPLITLNLILSLSKDEDTFSGFFSILLKQSVSDMSEDRSCCHPGRAQALSGIVTGETHISLRSRLALRLAGMTKR
jgi:hypothetical protein